MLDYSIYEKNSRQFHMNNPKPKTKNNHKNQISFKIILLKRQISICIDKYNSLEDLYIKMYNAVYPDFSTEKQIDLIPPPNKSIQYKTVPFIYYVSVFDNKENYIDVPINKFITISSFMQTKPEFFTNISYVGIPTFRIFALDEESLTEMRDRDKKRDITNISTYFEKITCCILRPKNKM